MDDERFLEEEHKDDPHTHLRNAHVAFQYLAPIMVVALVAYFIWTLYYSPSDRIRFIAQVTFSVFFGVEVLVDFLLYEDKWAFLKEYWFRILLVIPVIGALRVLGQLARLSRLLRLAKLIEKTVQSLDTFTDVRSSEPEDDDKKTEDSEEEA